MKNQQELIIILSVVLGITLVLFVIMVWYYKSEIKYKIETLNYWSGIAKERNEENIRLIKEKQKLINSCNGLENKSQLRLDRIILLDYQNKKYSKICRRLYDENNNLKLNNEGLESLFVDMKNKANEFELKIAELEKGKLKKKDRKL